MNEVPAVISPQPKSKNAERAPDIAISFVEAAALLNEAGPDLNAARDFHVAAKVRRGALPPDDAGSYSAMFDTAELSARDVRQVAEAMKGGKRFSVAFQTGLETPAGAFADLSHSGVQTHEWSPVSCFSQNAEDTRYGGTTIIFTSADLNVPSDMTNRTADDCIRESAQYGTDFVGPSAWTDLFHEAVYRGMKALHSEKDIDGMSLGAYRELCKTTLLDPNSGIDKYLLDVRTTTVFPGLRNDSGNFLEFYWDLVRGYRHVSVHVGDPQLPLPSIGPRVALGRVRREAA